MCCPGPGGEGESKTDWSNSGPDPRGKALIWPMQIESHQPHLLLTLVVHIASHSHCHQHSLLNSHTRVPRILSQCHIWPRNELEVNKLCLLHTNDLLRLIFHYVRTSVSHISWQEIVKQEVCQLTASQSFIMPFKILPFADTQTLSLGVINRFVSPLSAAQSGVFPLPSTRQPSQLRLSHHF